MVVPHAPAQLGAGNQQEDGGNAHQSEFHERAASLPLGFVTEFPHG